MLFLDEPSTGLDPQNRARLWEHVLDVRERFGTTLVLTTHYLEEADTKARRVLVIDHGRVIADAPPERLKADLAGDRVTVEVADEGDAPLARAAADGFPGLREAVVEGPRVSLRIPDGTGVLPRYLRELEGRGVGVAAAEVVRPTLDDVFLHLTGRSLREEGVVAGDERPAAPTAAGGR